MVRAKGDGVDGTQPDDWGWATELARQPAWRDLLIAEVPSEGGSWRPIGFMQFIDPALEDSHYWGDCASDLRAVDIWIGEADQLGRGHGTVMMRLALARCFAPPKVTAVIIDPLLSNAAALRFYLRLGFEAEGQRDFGADHCMVMRLTRAAWLALPAA